MTDSPINAGIASGKSFEERVGTPDSVTAALGHVVLAFAWLEQTVTRAIVPCLGNDEVTGYAVSAELAFQKKLHLLASLVRLNRFKRQFNTGADDPNDAFAAILAECFRAEELRNRLLHSYWESVPLAPDQMVRFKRTAKAKHGLRYQVEQVDSAAILDVADFIDSAASAIEMFFAPPIVVL